MSTFKDILDEGFERHARALPAGGGFSGDRSRSVLRSIHRRRRTRAAATAGGSVLAIGALAVGVMALRPSAVAQPGGTPPITNGLYPWCDWTTYPVVNPEAIGAAFYLGRTYEDLPNEVYVYADPNGTHQVLKLAADGFARFTNSNGDEVSFFMSDDLREKMLPNNPESRGVLFVDFDDENGGGRNDPGGPDGPRLGYEWTTVVPDVVPPVVNVESLSAVHMASLGLGGMTAHYPNVPEGAIAETVFRWHDGRQLAIVIPKGEYGAPVPDYTDLASVSLRVSNLPDGGVFEITSTYDASKTWQVACWPYRDGALPSASPSAGPTPTPSLSGWVNPTPSPGASLGGPSAGPTPTPSYVTPAPSSSPKAPQASPSPTPTT